MHDESKLIEAVETIAWVTASKGCQFLMKAVDCNRNINFNNSSNLVDLFTEYR